uniref:Exocyst complex component n=1 Tax=Globisporangium ultimum (strain ATCC 200006 / CBS 805.95 / DAOM BR144) TaxID=431595 RepID=K3X9R3_GLOUD
MSAPVARSSAWQNKPEWEVLVDNIAQSHSRLASGIQLAIEKQWGNNFTACLQAYANAKEQEIRGVCYSNYQEFVDSIEEIVRMKADVGKLQRDIDRFQHELASATSGVLTIHDSLDACYHVQKNIDESIEKLQQCQRIAGLATTIDMYIQQNKLFHALKVLEELRAEIAGFRGQLFPQRMNDWMHIAMETIKEEAKRSVSTWLEEIRAASLSIGEFAIKRFENQVSEQYYEQDILEKCGLPSTPSTPRPTGTPTAAMQTRGSGLPLNPSTPRGSVAPSTGSSSSLAKHAASGDELPKLPSLKVLNSDADLLREKNSIHAGYMKKTLEHLSPMLRILHVFRVMNQVPELAAFYNANRLPQLQLQSFLTGDVAMITPDKFISQHEELFKKFTGSFCLEHLLWKYSNEALLTKKEINGIFHLIVQSLCGIVTASILRIEAPKTILDIKRSAIMCARALCDEVHEYNPASIFDTFRRLGAHFRHSMLAETTKKLREFMTTDTFEHLKVPKKNLPEVLAVCGIHGQEEKILKNVDLTVDPVVLPLTDVVTKSCKAIESLVQMMYDYERYLNINDWGDAVRDDTIEALGILNDVLNEVIDQRSDLQVSMVVVIGSNASFLAAACDHFEQVVKVQTEAWEARTYGYSVNNTLRNHQLVKPNSNRLLLSKTGAKKKFESTMTRAQDMVCELMLKKIDELLASFYYVNWVPAEVSLQPDPSMWDLITYLKVTFSQLSHLPTVVREAIHFASCIHISKSMEQLLTGTTVRKLNMAGISNFKRNLDALLDYIGTIEIQQLKECFLALTQLLELLLSGQADKFLDPQQREAGRFSHLSAETVSLVLEKVKDVKSSKLWGSSSSSSSSQSTHKKTSLLGSVVKTLRK